MPSQWILDLEEQYERLATAKYFNSNTVSSPASKQIELYQEWLLLLHQRRPQNFFVQGRKLVVSADTADEKIFILSWLIIGCEVFYDLKSRDEFLLSLKKLALYDTSFQADSMISYFDGVSAYFASDFEVAEAKFLASLKLFEQRSDLRNQARAYLHLGLIHQYLENNKQAVHYTKLCLDICSSRNLYKTKERAFDLCLELTGKSGNSKVSISEGMTASENINQLVELIETSLHQQDHQMARFFLHKAEKLRRQQGFLKGRYSLIQYLTQIHFLKQKVKLGYLCLDAVKDPALYLKIVMWMNNNGIVLRIYDVQRKKKLEFLQKRISPISSAKVEEGANETVKLSHIAAADVSRLIQFLSTQERVSKEEIFEYVYNISYDPFLHDTKLYKLVLKAKKMIAQDLIVNHYGEYSLNRKKYRLVR